MTAEMVGMVVPEGHVVMLRLEAAVHMAETAEMAVPRATVEKAVLVVLQAMVALPVKVGLLVVVKLIVTQKPKYQTRVGTIVV